MEAAMGKKKDKARKAGRKTGADAAAGDTKRLSLCKWHEDAFADATVMAEAVLGATHVCRKCGRAANNPHRLCKPLPLV
jgi:ribosomal protein L37E